jgi:hypothetical protein
MGVSMWLGNGMSIFGWLDRGFRSFLCGEIIFEALFEWLFMFFWIF